MEFGVKTPYNLFNSKLRTRVSLGIINHDPRQYFGPKNCRKLYFRKCFFTEVVIVHLAVKIGWIE